MRVRREVTRPYSAATKQPFSRIRTARASSSKGIVMPLGPTFVGSIVQACGHRIRAVGAHLRRGERLFYSSGVRVEYRIEPCRTCVEPRLRDAVRLVAQPVHGLRAPLHVLLRALVRAARRPSVRAGLRHLDPGEGEHRRGAAARARTGRRGRARASRSARRPTPISPPRGASGSPGRASRCSRRRRTRSGSSPAAR